MNKAVYDSIGKNYNKNRIADNRISETIMDLLELPLGSVLADIGAGSGNYSNALADSGYKVVAIEPSEEMRNQSAPNINVNWLAGTAESIPLSENSVNGVIVVLSIHHFSDIRSAANEMKRICPKGPIIIFSLDPRKNDGFWFTAYFPEIYRKELKDFPTIEDVAQKISEHWDMHYSIRSFPLPHDLSDRNMRSSWNKPEDYLDAQMRRNTSGFALASSEMVQKGLSNLQNDLRTGKWDKEHGHLRKQETFHAGFYFMKFIA
ncbi:MAG: class I SAM-dependent methyltransferase [Desulfobacteraceae bacterium]|nr:class I SAM-dependent methyltransferase [Desulfobacteraceae bacterium]